MLYLSLLLFCRCEAVLGEFLRGIKRESENVKFAHMVNILVIHSQSDGNNNYYVFLVNNNLLSKDIYQ